MEQELDEEMRYHLDCLVDDYAGAGMALPEARYRALQEMGAIESRKEECRDARGLALVDSLRQDVIYALRALRKSPGFTAVAIVSLAIGIGANTTIFTFVNAVLLQPLSFPGSARLVSLHEHQVDSGKPLEIGVRLALGATTRQLFSELFGEGARLVIGGLALGAAMLLRGLVATLVFGVTPGDPLTYFVGRCRVSRSCAGGRRPPRAPRLPSGTRQRSSVGVNEPSPESRVPTSLSGLFRSFAERQIPSSKHHIPTHYQPPTSTRDWSIGTWECVGAWDVALGI